MFGQLHDRWRFMVQMRARYRFQYGSPTGLTERVRAIRDGQPHEMTSVRISV